MTFWDISAPIYDIAEKTNGKAYGDMLTLIRDLVPENSSVLEIAAGTGSISLAIAKKAKGVICTDLSVNMLKVASKKALKQKVSNIQFDTCDIFATGYRDFQFDVVIASQILHLLDNPEQAAAELKRISSSMVITPVCLLKNIGTFAKLKVGLWKLMGFAPKREFSADDYQEFLVKIGLPPSFFIVIDGSMPLAISVWKGC